MEPIKSAPARCSAVNTTSLIKLIAEHRHKLPWAEIFFMVSKKVVNDQKVDHFPCITTPVVAGKNELGNVYEV